MVALSLIFDEPAWPDLVDKPVIHLADDAMLGVAFLEGGMSSGKPSVALRFDLPDGSVVIAETSARLFCTAARAMLAKQPDLFDEE
jgi:hypothetical protein